MEQNRDELIGQNLLRLRGDKSQKELADDMRKRGWKWSQATVWSVEKGDRPLRLAEAESLATVLDLMDVNQLLELPLRYLFIDAQVKHEHREAALRVAALSMDWALYKLAEVADEWAAAGGSKELETELFGVDFTETPVQALERMLGTLPAPRASIEITHKGSKGIHLSAYFGDDDGKHQETP